MTATMSNPKSKRYAKGIDKTPPSEEKQEEIDRIVKQFMKEYKSPIQLLIHRFPWLYNTALRLRIDHKEIEAMCHVGVLRAARRFDPALGNKFSTYLGGWLKNAIQQGIRHQMKHTFALSDPKRKTDGTKISSLTGLLENKVRLKRTKTPSTISSLEQDEIEILWRALDLLPLKRRQIIEMRYGLERAEGGYVPSEKFTLSEIGKMFDRTKERIRQIENRILEELRYHIEEFRKEKSCTATES